MLFLTLSLQILVGKVTFTLRAALACSEWNIVADFLPNLNLRIHVTSINGVLIWRNLEDPLQTD